MPDIKKDVSLNDYSTMRLGGKARFFVEVRDADELIESVQFAKTKNLPMVVVGGGSNILWSDAGYEGLVIKNSILGFAINGQSVTIGAGENWDDSVERCVAAGLSGIEKLSLIPGTAGATPIQNVGAYGAEISDTLVSVEAYDTTEQKTVTINKADCGFAYRTSRFRTTDKNKFVILGITLLLSRDDPKPPFYPGLQAHLDDNNIKNYTAASIRRAVVAIRSAKLPDPKVTANCGSFFYNPIVPGKDFAELAKQYSDIQHWQLKDGKVKISAAWLIEQAGFKDFHDPATGMGTWPKQPLVFVNEHARSTADLLAFKQKVQQAIKDKFGIDLVQEPELIQINLATWFLNNYI